jgi:hypothetical protein
MNQELDLTEALWAVKIFHRGPQDRFGFAFLKNGMIVIFFDNFRCAGPAE